METLIWNDTIFSTVTVDGKRFWVMGLPVPVKCLVYRSTFSAQGAEP